MTTQLQTGLAQAHPLRGKGMKSCSWESETGMQGSWAVTSSLEDH
jgi:hypothetical protein